MFQQIFNLNNSFFRGCNKIFDAVVLSALWMALCLPIVTVGPATVALYYTAVKCLRRSEPEPYKNFFHSFKENFKVGTVSGLIALALLMFLWVGWLILSAADPSDTGGVVMRMAYRVALVIPLGTICWLFPVLSRFTFSVGGLFRTSLALAVKHLPSTVILVLLNLQAMWFCLGHLSLLAFAPAVTAILSSLFIERILKKYTAPLESEQRDLPKGHLSMGELPEEAPTDEAPWYLK